MAQKKGMSTVLGLGLVGLGIYLFTQKRGKITLSAGWNEVTYTGKAQLAGVANQGRPHNYYRPCWGSYSPGSG